jgi:hypothetical protein
VVSGSLVVVIDAEVVSCGGKEPGMVKSVVTGVDAGVDDGEERGDKNTGDPTADRGVG